MRAHRGWPELVIFDCDGVLVDSEALALGVTRRMLAEAGVGLSEAQVRERFLGYRRDAALARLETDRGAPLPDGFARRLMLALLGAFEAELKLMPGVREAIEGLGARICVASSSAPERLALSLRVTGAAEAFGPHIFSAEQVARGKPHPDLFLFAAREMGANPADCLVIEDSALGVQAARAAGMTAFGFVGGSHWAGAGGGAELTAAGADLIFADMGRLPAILSARKRRRAQEGG